MGRLKQRWHPRLSETRKRGVKQLSRRAQRWDAGTGAALRLSIIPVRRDNALHFVRTRGQFHVRILPPYLCKAGMLLSHVESTLLRMAARTRTLTVWSVKPRSTS